MAARNYDDFELQGELADKVVDKLLEDFRDLTFSDLVNYLLDEDHEREFLEDDLDELRYNVFRRLDNIIDEWEERKTNGN